jgi:hypothetical protein
MIDYASGGYFRINEEEHFPWDEKTKKVWFSLFVHDELGIKKRGFKSVISSKRRLLNELRCLERGSGAILIGIWNGKWSTHLFVLDIDTAIEKLEEVLD